MSAVLDESFDESSHMLPLRRQSFLEQPFGLFRGPNSLHHFATSFTRAQSFAAHKIDPDIKKKRSFFVCNDNSPEDELFDPELMMALQSGERLSTLLNETTHRVNGPVNYSTNNEVFYQDDVVNIINQSRSRQSSFAPFSTPIPIKRSHVISPSFSSERSVLTLASTASHFGLKKIEDKEGNLVTVIAGQSTAPQTVFNSVNVLIGVGLLALPVGLLKGGWVLGMPILILCCAATYWTATLLSKALDTDSTMMTYADLGYASYGSVAKLLISLIFSIDLLGLGVSLVLIFSDSLFVLLGDDVYWTKTKFKVIAFVVLTPFTFLPLPVLSIISLLGILSTISLTIIVLLCGLLKLSSPGSLLLVMPTNLWPNSASELFISIGILMAPFGGHAIFPNLKSDMRHPEKFVGTLATTYSITMLTDCTMAVIGFFMFGALNNNEVTSILLETSGYPSFIYPLISFLICIIPLAKTPLNAKPIISTLDSLLALDLLTEGESKFVSTIKSLARFFVRVMVNFLFVAFAVLIPEFEKIIGILGSSICFLICIILPCLFYLKLCKGQIRGLEKFLVQATLFISVALAVVCSYVTIVY